LRLRRALDATARTAVVPARRVVAPFDAANTRRATVPTTYTVSLTPFEALLEDLHAATVASDEHRATELRATIEADLAERERAAAITEAR
jgi:hypothetical protein